MICFISSRYTTIFILLVMIKMKVIIIEKIKALQIQGFVMTLEPMLMIIRRLTLWMKRKLIRMTATKSLLNVPIEQLTRRQGRRAQLTKCSHFGSCWNKGRKNRRIDANKVSCNVIVNYNNSNKKNKYVEWHHVDRIIWPHLHYR